MTMTTATEATRPDASVDTALGGLGGRSGTAADALAACFTVSYDSCWIIRVEGELDLLSSDILPELAELLVGQRAEKVHIDLADVSFVDVTGWTSVLSCLHIFASAGTAAGITASSPRVKRMSALSIWL